MPKFVVAFNKDVEKEEKTPLRIAKSAIAHIKEAIREYPGTDWLIKFYDMKPDVENVCKLAQSIGLLTPTDKYMVHVNMQGQVRKS